MNLKQIIDLAEPLAFWRTENYSNNNVFDEYLNYTLVNNNAILAENGSTNHNLASKSINLRGGYLDLVDTTFLNNELTSLNCIISFNLMVTATVIGFKPIISKWYNNQSFIIGFENGSLMAKVRTNAGLLELTLLDDIITYSGRWNRISLSINSINITFKINGLEGFNNSISTVNNGSPIISSNTNFRIGGQGGDTLTTDCYINDIAVTKYYENFDKASHILTRSVEERILDFQPLYYFNIADSFNLNPSLPIENKGTKGGNIKGYLSGVPINQFSSTTLENEYNENGVIIPQGGYFTIDNDLQLDFTIDNNVCIMFQGGISDPLFNVNYTTFPFKIYEFALNKNNNAWRLEQGMGWNGENGYTRTWSYDGNGNQLVKLNTTNADQSPQLWRKFGIKSFKLGGNSGNINSLSTPYYSNVIEFDINNKPAGLYQPSTLGYNRFFYDAGTSRNMDYVLSKLMIFNRIVNNELISYLQYPTIMIKDEYFRSVIKYISYTGRTCVTDYEPLNLFLDYDGQLTSSLYSLDYTGSENITPNIIDNLYNKNNIHSSSVYLADNTKFTSQHTTVNTSLNINKNNILVSFFVHNINNTTSYRLCMLDNGVFIDNNTNEFVIKINSNNGNFSYGDIEVAYKSEDLLYTFYSSSKKVKNDGYHLVTLYREGLKNELYIDGELDTTFITPTIYEPLSGKNWRFYGGSCYISNIHISFFADNITSKTIFEYLFNGFADILKGETTIDNNNIQSNMFIMDEESKQIIHQSATDINGNFDINLKKGIDNSSFYIIATPTHDNITNNIVVHGSYASNVTYSKLIEEQFEENVSEMIIDMQPLAYYQCNDVSGVNIIDSIGTIGNGIISGTSYTLDNDGINGKSIYLDGVDSFIDLPDGFNDFTNGLTFEYWAKDETVKNDSRIVEIASGANGVNSISSHRNNSTNNLKFDATGTGSNINLSNILELGVWKHYVMRILPNFTKELWVNGNLQSTVAGTSLPVTILRTLNYIGKSTYSGDDYYNGYISDVAIYDYPLSIEDINKHAKRSFTTSAITLKSTILNDNATVYYTFDRLKTITEELDNINNNLSLNGSVIYDKNSIVINQGVVGNNYLFNNNVHVNPQSTNLWSIEFSFKTINNHATNGVIVSEWNEGLATGTFKIQLEAGGVLKCYLNNSAVSINATSFDYNNSKFNHVVLICENNNFELFINNVSRGTLSSSIVYSNNEFTVGNCEDHLVSTYLEHETHIDDLAIYEHVLTPLQIETHYNKFVEKKDTL